MNAQTRVSKTAFDLKILWLRVTSCFSDWTQSLLCLGIKSNMVSRTTCLSWWSYWHYSVGVWLNLVTNIRNLLGFYELGAPVACRELYILSIKYYIEPLITKIIVMMCRVRVVHLFIKDWMPHGSPLYMTFCVASLLGVFKVFWYGLVLVAKMSKIKMR